MWGTYVIFTSCVITWKKVKRRWKINFNNAFIFQLYSRSYYILNILPPVKNVKNYCDTLHPSYLAFKSWCVTFTASQFQAPVFPMLIIPWFMCDSCHSHRKSFFFFKTIISVIILFMKIICNRIARTVATNLGGSEHWM